MNRTDRLYIRLTPDLKAQLKQMADEQHRTLSNFVEQLLIEAVATQSEKTKK